MYYNLKINLNNPSLVKTDIIGRAFIPIASEEGECWLEMYEQDGWIIFRKKDFLHKGEKNVEFK